jgi:hypothetical protein
MYVESLKLFSMYISREREIRSIERDYVYRDRMSAHTH